MNVIVHVPPSTATEVSVFPFPTTFSVSELPGIANGGSAPAILAGHAAAHVNVMGVNAGNELPGSPPPGASRIHSAELPLKPAPGGGAKVIGGMYCPDVRLAKFSVPAVLPDVYCAIQLTWSPA